MNKKKIWIFACMIAIISTLTACSGQGASSAVGNEKSQTISSSIVSSGEAASDAAASEAAASEAATSEAVTANTASPAASPKALTGKNTGDYQVKSAEYSYNKDNMVYKADYLQLSGKIANLDKINSIIKNSALQTINSLGTAKKSVKTTVKVSGDVTYEGKDFISAGFNEYATLSPKVKAERVLRTVNINLKTGASVAAKDLIVKNDALYNALEKAAKAQKSASISTSLTAAAIKAGLDSNVIYFTEQGVGFWVQTTGGEKYRSTITLTYEEVKPFITKNEIWKNFM